MDPVQATAERAIGTLLEDKLVLQQEDMSDPARESEDSDGGQNHNGPSQKNENEADAANMAESLSDELKCEEDELNLLNQGSSAARNDLRLRFQDTSQSRKHATYDEEPQSSKNLYASDEFENEESWNRRRAKLARRNPEQPNSGLNDDLDAFNPESAHLASDAMRSNIN